MKVKLNQSEVKSEASIFTTKKGKLTKEKKNNKVYYRPVS